MYFELKLQKLMEMLYLEHKKQITGNLLAYF